MLKKEYSKNKPLCKVTFTLSKEAAKTAKQVVVLGEFNDWNEQNAVAMKASKAEFKAVVELPAGKNYQFRYLVDGKVWMNDAAADAYQATPFGVENSVVFVDEVLDVVAPKAKKTTKKVTAKAAPAAKKATTKVEKTVVKAKATTKKVVAKKAVVKKTVAKKAAKVVADDLKKIEGIGPKIAGLLNAAGIVSFKDMATAKVETLKEVLKNAGPRFKMHNPATWVEQATLAAKGDWTTLKTLQDELKGGKRK